jgi:hypothetical protein
VVEVSIDDPADRMVMAANQTLHLEVQRASALIGVGMSRLSPLCQGLRRRTAHGRRRRLRVVK